jgi:hypothetical protein
MGLQPGFCSAEVVLSGRFNELGGVTPVDDLDVGLAFYRSFGEMLPFGMISRSWGETTSGKQQVGTHIQMGDLASMTAPTKKAGKGLDDAVREFEAAALKVACAGSLDAFLQSGGSLKVTLSVLKPSESEGPLSIGAEPVLLMDMDIETEDCEAN